MKRFPLFIALVLLAFSAVTTSAVAQSKPGASDVTTSDPKLDSLTKLSQKYLNDNQPDSLYALMAESFKAQISADKMKEVSSQLVGQLGKWTAIEPKGVQDGVGKYKATFALAALDFFIGLDKQGKIETFLFKPITE
ncbi:DUF3887 domain-containing protein [Spirosoma sp. KUDC1026]|uniref:DUF3887 domain-containing protein n=1 Tax=Spirosoma sp. KUDC1026 TaxID=2745947 RepID=UPI00159BCF25|nr:DUF3887 domain-containing protein [Spirosoma sp. KUDC1026]QKZ11743.1 DUF3887 domain-containing protein [Spirosoma sp. KUDC1026]